MQISELEKEIIAFRDARNWKQFHSVKDLIMGLNIEASELSELFLWKNESEIAEIDKQEIADELADIFVYLNYLAHHFEIDLAQAVLEKMNKNNLKYPIEKSYNSNKKYNQLWLKAASSLMSHEQPEPLKQNEPSDQHEQHEQIEPTRKRRVRYKGTYPSHFHEKYKELNPEQYPDDIQKVISKGNTPAGMHISICGGR